MVEPYQLYSEALLHSSPENGRVVRQYNSTCQWLCVKRPSHKLNTPMMKAKNHEILGLLYLQESMFTQAVREFAHCAYYTAMEFGPEHVEMTSAYGFVARAFFEHRGDMQTNEKGMAVVNRVLGMWRKFMEGREPDHWRQELDAPGMARGGARLHRILQYCEEFCGAQHNVTGQAHYVVGLWHETMQKHEHAADQYKAAEAVARTHADSSLLEVIQEALERVK